MTNPTQKQGLVKKSQIIKVTVPVRYILAARLLKPKAFRTFKATTNLTAPSSIKLQKMVQIFTKK
jgi:hypothetical protein